MESDAEVQEKPVCPVPVSRCEQCVSRDYYGLAPIVRKAEFPFLRMLLQNPVTRETGKGKFIGRDAGNNGEGRLESS